MTRIMANPERMNSLGLALQSAVGELQGVAGQSAGAYRQLDWEAHRKANVEEMVQEAERYGQGLFEVADQLARFVRAKADLFASLDQGLAARVGGVGAGAAGALAAGAAAMGAGVVAGRAPNPAGAAVSPTPAAPETTTLIPGAFSASPEELRTKMQALPRWGRMVQWADLIWKVGREKGLPAEIIAANMMQESGGNPRADAGKEAGKGLMQIEFSAHRSSMHGETDAEKLAWVFQPENNVRLGADIMKENLDRWISRYGPEEGLKRGLQYWNYGSGAAQWVEEHCTGPHDWQQAVDTYHKTHTFINHKLVEVPSGGDYGTPKHWEHVFGYFRELVPQKSAGAKAQA